MAEVRVKVKEEFRDRTASLKLRKKDEILTVSDERAKKLAGLGLVEICKATKIEEAGRTETEEPPWTIG